MKLICSQSDLNTNLSIASRAVPSRPTHPVLGNVLLIADEETQKVSLRAFDLSLGIQTSFAAQVEEGGIITLPAKTLNDIVSRLPEGEITLSLEEDENIGDETVAIESELEIDAEDSDDDEDSALTPRSLPREGSLVTLTCTDVRYQLRSMDPEEFPELPEVEDGEAVKLPIEALIEGLRSTLFAASTEETKQVLTGVHLTLKTDTLEFAATDGHRLAVVETVNLGEGDDNEPEEFEVTIPARALRELERMLSLPDQNDLVTLLWDEGQVIFELGSRRLTSRKLEGAYPNYRQLIPQQFTNQINLDRRQFLNALERVSVLADQKNNVVKCAIDYDNQQLFLSVDAPDVGRGRESIAAQVNNSNPKEIAFNIKYLTDGLKALSSSEITIHLNSANQPVIFTPLGGLKMTYLAMPVQLRS